MKEKYGIGYKYWDLFEERIEETCNALSVDEMPMLRRLSLHITNKCNLNCKYCNERHNPKELDFELFKKLVKEYDSMGGGVLHVTGGEPMSTSYIYDAIEFVSDYKNIAFHINTNLVKRIPIEYFPTIKRLKVSIDSHREDYFDSITGIRGTFNKVVNNLKEVDRNIVDGNPIISLTYTLTKDNYRGIIDFLNFYYDNFKNFYATFFSCYKGSNERFAFDKESIDDLFSNYVPEAKRLMEENGDKETKFLFDNSHDRKTFVDDVRFEENKVIPCYLQLSELCINEDGEVWNCSHLFRDKVSGTGLNIKDHSLSEIFMDSKKMVDLENAPLHPKCLYGCNKKLTNFNKEVHQSLLLAHNKA